MKKSTTFFIIGFLAGIVITAVVLFTMAPDLLLKENESRYGFDESVDKFEAAVLEAGWKIPVAHDLQATLHKNGKENINPVVVYELCNPDLAAKILETNDERTVSAMMPCRVAIYEKGDGKVYFSRMNSGLFSKAMGKVTREQMARANRETEKFLLVLEK